MKKLLFAACVLFALLLCSAWADQTVTTEHFELTLSDSWYPIGSNYLDANLSALQMQEQPMVGYSEATLDANSNAGILAFRKVFIDTLDVDVAIHQEPLTVAGKPSVLYYFKDNYGYNEFYTFTWGDETMCVVIYIDKNDAAAKNNFLSIVSTLRRKDAAPAATQAPAGKAVEVPNGEWVVGKGIPVGNYSVRYAGVAGGGMVFQVWRSAVGDYSNNGLIYNELVTADSPLGRIELRSGYVVVIKNGPALFGYPIKLGF